MRRCVFMYLPGPGQRFLTLKSAAKPPAQLLQKQPGGFLPPAMTSWNTTWGRKSKGGKRFLSFIRGCIKIVQCGRTLQDSGERGCKAQPVVGLLYFNAFKKKGGYSVTWMVSCRKAVPQAPSLGRFDVLLLSFEVEKCGLCFLFVGEKCGEIDKKLMYVCLCVRACMHACVRDRARICMCSSDKNRIFVGWCVF